MADLVQFEPIFQEHAIERCSAAVILQQPLPDKFFAKIQHIATDTLPTIGLLPVQQPQFGFQINISGNQMTPLNAASAPMTFASSDGSTSVTITANSVVYQTTSYVRWRPFVGQFEEFIEPIIATMQDISSVSVIKLDYIDRFFWTGDWDTIDYSELLEISSPLLAEQATKGRREWHNHVGWFDYLADHRRLFNVNVDVFEVPRAGRETLAPSVGILTMAQDQPLVSDMHAPRWAEGRPIAPVLEEQHIELHRLLASVITRKTADRIGLRLPL